MPPASQEGGFHFRISVGVLISHWNPEELTLPAQVAICRKLRSLQAKQERCSDLNDFLV